MVTLEHKVTMPLFALSYKAISTTKCFDKFVQYYGHKRGDSRLFTVWKMSSNGEYKWLDSTVKQQYPCFWR